MIYPIARRELYIFHQGNIQKYINSFKNLVLVLRINISHCVVIIRIRLTNELVKEVVICFMELIRLTLRFIYFITQRSDEVTLFIRLEHNS